MLVSPLASITKEDILTKVLTTVFLHLDNLGTQQVLCVSPQSLTTLRDPMVCSPPGSSICGLLQARTLEWAASSFSRCSVYIYGLNSPATCEKALLKEAQMMGEWQL